MIFTDSTTAVCRFSVVLISLLIRDKAFNSLYVFSFDIQIVTYINKMFILDISIRCIYRIINKYLFDKLCNIKLKEGNVLFRFILTSKIIIQKFITFTIEFPITILSNVPPLRITNR